MWQYNYSDELYHHGVKGMKWGVRHKRKYEKLGFEAGEVISDEDDAWGGLTSMKLKLH